MRDVIYLLFHLLTTVAKLLRPGGGKTIIAENLLLKQQLIIHSRSRQRAPNLSTQDRALLGFLSLFLNPRRLVRSAIIIKPSTLLRFHNALKKRKYRLLYSPGDGRVLATHCRPDPSNHGPSWLTTIGHAKDSLWSVDLFRCESIGPAPRLLKSHWVMVVMDLENKLSEYQCYYNDHRCHSSRDGTTPVVTGGNKVTDIKQFLWEKHCRGLFELPGAA